MNIAATEAARGRHWDKKERVVLVGVSTKDQDPVATRQHLAELARLADSAGAEIAGEVVQNRQTLDPATVLGAGKVKALAELCDAEDIDKVVFDDDLSPSQAKRVEELTGRMVLDRSGLILDIFARQARTRESKLQVEIAQLEYLIPRLTKMWTHLERQGGGIGTLGPGETQLETDRRIARTRLAKLKRELESMEVARGERGKQRKREAFSVALAGYTNAGKSTLLNALTGAKVLAQDRLFSTLDATTRKVWLGHESPDATLSDTVGFIRKLPHHLVASFRSTLAVVAEADLVLHLVDASDMFREEEMRVAHDLLEELCGRDLPRLVVFNKIDALDDADRQKLAHDLPQAIQVSAAQKLGFDLLRENMRSRALAWREERRSKADKELDKALEELELLEASGG
ncbi:MAG TPA: GTPase HflX [Fibrobacteria bacterium]|nr:GTPase HflX [Fibrobacteria bacterium]